MRLYRRPSALNTLRSSHHRAGHPPRPGAAFTLFELLVVIAILGILASLLLPALSRVQTRGQGLTCMNQLRQLSLGMQLYATDFGGRLPYNLGSADTRKAVRYGKLMNWANNVLSWELDPDNTNTTWLIEGGLGPYVGRNATVFRCPADHALSELQRSAGWTSRARSYSLNAMVGNAGEFSYEGFNVNNPRYTQFFSEAAIPQPSRIFTFIEEHPDSINDGYFLNRLWQREWFDLPGSWHGGAVNLTFADGHAESHRWLSDTTTPAGRAFAVPLPLPLPDERAEADFDWLMWRTSVAR